MSTRANDSIEIVYAREPLIASFHACLDAVAREKIYIEMTEAPPLDKAREFEMKLIAAETPVYYAVDGGSRVVGFCDLVPIDNPRQRHRAALGIGLLPEYRGRGIGSRLLAATLAKAKACEIEKAELHVYTTNLSAIALYRKFQFVEEGLIRDYRRVDGRSFDCLIMGRSPL